MRSPRSLLQISLLPAFALSLAWMPAVAGADDAFQVWYQSTIWLQLGERWSVGNYTLWQVEDGFGETSLWQVSPRLRYEVSPHLQLQLNTTWLDSSNLEQTRRSDSFRLEFEVNPRFHLTEQLQLTIRDRFEWRWTGGRGQDGTRFRIRPQFDWLLMKKGLFRGIYASEEIFYDFERDRITQNRLIPFGVILRPAEPVEFRLYYLWAHALGSARWFNAHVAGIQVTLNF